MQKAIQWIEARPLWAVLALSSILLLSGNWILPLIDRDEPSFAEASREMPQRSDYVVPRFDGRYRLDKPPLVYWCQVAAYEVFGEDEFAARLPSVVFATATALLLLAWGRRLNNEKAGLYAALMFVSCLQLLIYGRLAIADMPMVFFVTLAVWCGWEMTRPTDERKGWWWWFFISLGLGFLAKGPEAWLPLFGVMLASWMRPQDFRVNQWSLLPGLAPALVVPAVWGVPALMRTHGEFWTVGIGYHVIHRSFAVMEGHGFEGLLGYVATLPLYFITFFAGFLPWSIRLPSVIRNEWRSRVPNALGFYLLTQSGVIFVVFTLVRTKLAHYTLPAFPCLALWLALNISHTDEAGARLAKGLAVMTALVLTVSLGFVWAASKMVTANLWRKTESAVTPDMRVAAVRFSEPSLVWEFRSVITNNVEYIKVGEANAFLQGKPPLCLVVPTRDLQDRTVQPPKGAELYRATGYDTADLDYWDLTAVIRR